jgi:serine/threonine protein kinase
MSSLIGQTINDRYRLDALLGDGGMGTVFRAFDRNLDRQVAIKLMHSHFARQPEFRRRLIQEAQTAAKLDHPSIVRIYDFGESDLGLFITMEYVDGGSLREHLQRLQSMDKFLPLTQSLQIGIQIAEALDYAHRRGVIHRDVKPGNIILKRLSHPDEPGEQPFRSVLTDFGLVKLQEGVPMTQSGATVGTPAYMSPEQCEGVPLDGRTDLYSLGIVLYELVTNRLPFTFQSLADAISTHRRGTRPAPPSDYRSDAPALIDGLLAKALAKSPDDRFADGAEMAAALRSAKLSLEGTPTRIMTRQELNILDRVEEPPEGYELLISAPGHQPSVMSLLNSTITVGRNADNDIVLPADGVSRHHARLQATSLGWEVVDLGSGNGTFLNDRRLRPEEPAPMLPGSNLRIGPYELVLQAPDISSAAMAAGIAGATVPGGTTRGFADVETTRRETAVAVGAAAAAGAAANAAAGSQTGQTAGALAIFAVQDTVEVDPGQEVLIKAEVANRGDVDDRVSVRVQGIPPQWITSPTGFVSVASGETADLTIGVRPPRSTSTAVGRQRMRLELISQRHPEVAQAVTVNLVVNPFFAFAASLEPAQVRLPGTITVSVKNIGSSKGDFSIVARDAQEALAFTGEQGRIPLDVGQVARVNYEVSSQQSSFFGNDELYPYEVNVISRSGGRQQLTGEAVSAGMLPPWLLYTLAFLTLLCCGALAFAAIFNRERFLPPVPTATIPFAGLVATQTAAAMTQTAVALLPGTGTLTPTVDATATLQTATAEANAIATATAAAATAAAQGDSDGDGLSNAQEGFIGTDPFNADTDRDRLNDGQEVLVFGTNPLVVDTDRDGFPDGQEVLDLGSDPLDPFDPVGRPPTMPPMPPPVTRTMWPPPRPTWTPTRPIQPPTWTPVSPPPTWTSTVVPPTWTSTPVPPTWTNTPPPSVTATSSVTPPPSLTPTPTDLPPGPNPPLACISPAPVIDGVFSATEWPPSPMAQFAAPSNPSRRVTLYGGQDAGALYFAMLVNDPAVDPSDEVRLGFDVTKNGGDPDSSDRFLIVRRDGTSEIWAGIGSNNDGLLWDSSYSSGNWTAVVGESAGQWVAEIEIAAAEMPALANPFGMMAQGQSTSDVATWPGIAYGNDPSTWQGVSNPTCG